MRNKIAFVLIFSFFSAFTFAQTENDTPVIEQTEESINGPIMMLESTVVDYGTIDQHSEPLRTIAFTNTGVEPLVITNARGSCGCTVPTWPKEPVMPGETSQIEIRYATNRLGKFSKKVTLTTNEGGDQRVLTVQGNVLKKEEQSVPEAEPSMLNTNEK